MIARNRVRQIVDSSPVMGVPGDDSGLNSGNGTILCMLFERNISNFNKTSPKQHSE